MAEVEAGRDGAKPGYINELRAARNKVRASFINNQRYPSADSESPPREISSQMLPMRDNIIDATISMDQMDETADNDDDGLTTSVELTLRLPEQKPREKIILLPMVSIVREIYENAILKHKHDIQQFFSRGKMDPTITANLDEMIEELKLLVDHQDLITEESSTQRDASDEFQAKWALTCSCKCLFVDSFLNKMRQEEKQIAILARPGKILGILESILRWHEIPYERIGFPAQPKSGNVGGLKVILLPTNLTSEDFGVVNQADVVIALDDTFRQTDHYSTFLRGPISDSKKLPLLISLVVAYSPEHIELCLPKTVDFEARKIWLIDFITQTRKHLGKLEELDPSPDEAAVIVTDYLLNDEHGDSAWPLPKMPDITVLQSSSGPVAQKASRALSHLHDSRTVSPQGPMKRTLRAGSITGPDLDLAKRLRMTPTLGEVSSGSNVTRVSDSMGSRSQSSNIADLAIARAPERNNKHSMQISAFVEKISELEAKVLEKESAREQLTKRVKVLEQRLDDHISTIKIVRPKLLEAIIDRGNFEAERDEAIAKAASVTQTITSRNTEIAKLKEEKRHLEAQLINALNVLANSTIPGAAALAQAQEQARTVQSDKDRLEKRISNLQRQVEFTREVYQKASSHNTQLDREVSELQGVNTVLQRKASENMVRIAEIQKGNETREREGRIEELEALLRDREAELRKTREELKVKTNGRRETRGTSVPRSPRTGFSRVTGGSRGVSPAPGEYAHPGKGDPAPLLPSSLGSARYGHLSG